jgi:exosortase
MLIDTLKPHPAVAPAHQPVRAVITSPSPAVPPPRPAGVGRRAAVYAAVAAAVAWAFLPTLDWLVSKWIDDPSYSHGFLVPLFSGYLLYLAWQAGTSMTSAPRPLAAAGVLLAALPLRLLGGGLLFHQLDVLAFLLTLFAGVLAVGGYRLARVAAPAAVFLLFMIPLPYEIEQNVGGPLKTFATAASTFTLQTLGYPAVSMGNVIHIDEVTLGVVDQCSGLKMLVAFSAFAVGAVLLTRRTPAEQFFILLGFVPIAVLTNVLRIVATGVVYTATADKGTRDFSHDLFGWLMMPLGLALLAVQLWVQGRLVVNPAADEVPPPRWATS